MTSEVIIYVGVDEKVETKKDHVGAFLATGPSVSPVIADWEKRLWKYTVPS